MGSEARIIMTNLLCWIIFQLVLYHLIQNGINNFFEDYVIPQSWDNTVYKAAVLVAVVKAFWKKVSDFT